MKVSTRAILIVLAVMALAFAGGALAANSGSFLDDTRDAGGAPDLSRVAIANDDAGKVTIRVEVSDRAVLGAFDEVMVLVDADQNPDTGSVFYGAEFGLDLISARSAFLVPQTSGYLAERTQLPPSFAATFANGAATFSFDAAELGIAAGSRFGVLAASFRPAGIDLAPEMRTVSYPLVAGTPTVELGPDRRAPLTEPSGPRACTAGS